MPIITVLNRKGGVGKTSVCWHLGGTLASLGKRVLLVDLDPQASLSAAVWGDELLAAIDPADTVAAAWSYSPPPVQLLAAKTVVPTLEIVPGSEALAARNLADPEAAPRRDQAALADFLAGADGPGGWDFVIVDTPPQLQLLTWAALLASSHALVPIQPEDFGSKGLSPVSAMCGRARAAYNPGLAPEVLVLSMFDKRLSVHQMYEERLRGRFGGSILAGKIPNRASYKEAITNRLPIHRYEPRGDAAKAMKAVAGELLSRLAAPAPDPAEVPSG